MKKFLLSVAVLAVMIAACSTQQPSNPAPSSTHTPTMTNTEVTTPTTTPTVVCTQALGYWGDNDDGAWGSSEIIAIPITPAKSGTIDALGLKLYGAVSYAMAVYTDVSGEPGDVIVQTAVISGATGWNETAITPTSLTQGVTYWLAAQCSGFGVCDYDPVSNLTWRHNYTWSNVVSTGMPSGLTGWSTGSGEAKMYASGCF